MALSYVLIVKQDAQFAIIQQILVINVQLDWVMLEMDHVNITMQIALALQDSMSHKYLHLFVQIVMSAVNNVWVALHLNVYHVISPHLLILMVTVYLFVLHHNFIIVQQVFAKHASALVKPVLGYRQIVHHALQLHI